MTINRKRKKYSLIASIALLWICIYQNSSGQYNKINFDNFTTEHGLSDNYINCVFQDHNGWIWIGTGMGIERFDGIKFKKYVINSTNTEFKEALLARNFYESRAGILYACAEELGLTKYNRKNDCFERLLIKGKPVLTDVSVKDLAEDKEGNLWAATKKGICRIDFKNEKTTLYSHDEKDSNSLISNYVRKLVFDNNSQLWAATQNGLDRFTPQTGSFFHFSKINQQLNDDILDILIDNQKRLWIGTSNNGISIISEDYRNISRFIPDEKNERSYKVNTIFQDNEGKFWIGTRGGLYFFDEQDKQTILIENNPLEENSLVHNSIMNIMQDRKGDMWIATRAGLSYMIKEKQIFEYYKALPGNNKYLNNGEIYCIWIDKSEKVWLGTENGGINILDRKTGTFKYITTSSYNGLSNNCIKSINSAGDGKVLIGTFHGGLNIYDEKTGIITWLKHHKDNKNSISNNIIWDIDIDKKGNIWIGTASGLDKYNPKTQTFIHYPEFDDMVNGVTWIGVDSDDDLWLGSEIIKVFRPNHGIINVFKEKSRGLFVDSKGKYWIMTGNKGIALYNKIKGLLKTYDEKAGIASKLTYCMLEDDKGKLWVSTANGLSCFDPVKESFKNYYNIDGLQGNQFHYVAAFKAKNGELFFGGVHGLNVFNPQQIIENRYIPPVYITDLKIFNQSVIISNDKNAILKESITETKYLKIPYKYNALSFEFAALNYAKSSRNNYKYMLEGFDKTWTETSETRSATYTNLNPGEYNFKVIASNDNGIWNNKGSSKKIIILPPFYRTVWFMSLLFCAVLMLFSFVFYIIFKRRELRNALEFEKVKAQQLHDLDTFKLQFFTNISHEIKTPLTLIISPLKKILKQNAVQPEIKENLHLMEKNAEHLMQLVTQLLDYRKLQEGKLKIELKRGDIVEFCRNIFLSFEGLMREKELGYKFGSVPKKIDSYFDPDKLKTILNNLISNAIRYNKRDGSVVFMINLFVDQGEKSFGIAEHAIKIVVKDTGVGINEKEINKIFDRYYSKTSESFSSGIGLSFTRELVELHNGRIYVESKEGDGSSFTVIIPFKEDTVETISEYPPQEISSKDYIKTKNFESEQKNKRVLLVVEDNEDVRRFIKSNFTNEYIVLESLNGMDGWHIAVQIIPDIIISDIMMPEMDGTELCEKVKKDERTSHIPVILLTALSSKESTTNGLIKGADDYITKPFDIDILKTKIENLLKVRQSLQEKYSKQMVIQPSNISIKTPDEKFLEKTIKIIENNIDDTNLDIDKLIDQIGVSRMQLYRKIAALTNMTVKEFVNDIRLKRAAQILSENKINVSEVAYAVGFNDLSYFGKCFKRKFGISASEFTQKTPKH